MEEVYNEDKLSDGLTWASGTICRISNQCDQCRLLSAGQKCFKDKRYEHLFCDMIINRIDIYTNSYLYCDQNKNELIVKHCAPGEHFENGTCSADHQRYKREGVAGAGRVGDYCAFNSDCLNGMFCSSGTCSCRNNFVAVYGYCYLRKNLGENGCQYSEQCSAAWPGARCEENKCECPSDVNGIPYVQARTRDGIVCILLSGEDGDPVPKCPLPEYDDDLLTMPVSQLRNPAMTDPDDYDVPSGEHINPLQFCSSTSTNYKTFIANGGGACTYATEPYQPENGIYIADIYECVSVPLNDVKLAMKGIYDIHPQADGICCPNRAFTCIQPKHEANPNAAESTGVRPRWWFNSVTGTCEQFMWDPWDDSEIQSPNNFKTREHCESYCRDTCKRGSPEYSTSNEKLISNCQTTASCSSNYHCKTIGWRQFCCPTDRSICSAAGGRLTDTSRHTNFDPGYSMKRTFNLNYERSIRYYYDWEQNRCKAFTYNGAFGNFNNFKTSIECETFCERFQCKYGMPLKIKQINQQCNSNNDCPSTYECQMDYNICCPRPQAICSQPLRIGNCKQNIRRYWYNGAIGACEMFQYSGCHGNDNNFETMIECQNTCENTIPKPQCPQGDAYKDYQGNYIVCSISDGCPLNYECYFDGYVWGCCPTKTYTCCGGNSNNFLTYESCESYCSVSSCPNGGIPERNEFGQQIACSSAVTCPATHECTSIISGNSILNRCCPTRAYICSLPLQQGNLCNTSTTSRFYFNTITKTCTKFTYNGCGDNLNNFATLEQCNNFCFSSACDSGDTVYLNPRTRTPLECKIDVSSSCPSNFTCTYDKLLDKNVCCGATDMGVCPEGEKAYINVSNISVRECLINASNSCPINYLCRLHAQTNRHFCCTSISTEVCPRGKALYKDPSSKLSIRCIINSKSDQCPLGYSCLSDVPGALQSYCCSSNYLCPNQAKFYVEMISELPRTCELNASFNSCPVDYACQSMQAGVTAGYCCETDNATMSDGCPPNKYVYVKDNHVISCDPFNLTVNTCPDGYSCQWSLPKRRYQCCGTTTGITEMTSLGCPKNQVAYRDAVTNGPKVCTIIGQNCPLGYFCQFSTINNQFQCCGISNGCQNEQVVFVGKNGKPESCIPGQTICPVGYSCQETSNKSYFCCTIDSNRMCAKEEILIEGECLEQVEPGDLCIDDKQCLRGSRCLEGICECPNGLVFQKGKCVANETKTIKCPIYGQRPYQEKRSGKDYFKVRYCLPLKNDCPKGYSCQYSRDADRNICCGNSDTNNSGSISKSKSLSAWKQSQIATAVCDNGIPYTLKGVPQTCTEKLCPTDYECIFSKNAQNYFCCLKKIKQEIQDDGCPSGKALLFPATGTPLLCNNGEQNFCPNGYRCLRNNLSNGYQCCTISNFYSFKEEFTTNNPISRFYGAFFNKAPCPQNQVQVKRYMNGQYIDRCEDRCPAYQTAIGGFCKDIA
uniref:BPTI/Kunitz inhibitor domain-containing protein n=1 Tax=Setaria digitata TaxID=48799 RepID=A0A915PL09_9BILA